MLKKIINVFVIIVFLFCLSSSGDERLRIKAIGIPLADHYAGIVAYEKYRQEMKYADYQILILPSPDFVRAYFRSEPDADIAFNVAPMVMDMYAKNPNFKWVSLIHRDGNALAVNKLLSKYIDIPEDKLLRKPTESVADAFKRLRKERGKQIVCAIPSPLATHTIILYKYFKDNGVSFSVSLADENKDVLLKIIKPPKSPFFLRAQDACNKPAAFEQSLPWTEIVETESCGKVAWYSKDIMNFPKGHVECIIIAKNKVIKNKRKALREVIYYIHKAGLFIENARRHGGKEMDEVVQAIQKHIPSHTKASIIEGLRPDINAINYINLNVDSQSKDSFREIMNLAFEAGFIKKKIDINELADESFGTEITKKTFPFAITGVNSEH